MIAGHGTHEMLLERMRPYVVGDVEVLIRVDGTSAFRQPNGIEAVVLDHHFALPPLKGLASFEHPPHVGVAVPGIVGSVFTRAFSAQPPDSQSPAELDSKQVMTRRRTKPERTERMTRDGAVLLTHNHVALLQGLLDCPGGISHSCEDLVNAGFPYLARWHRSASITCFAKTVRTLHPLWVVRVRVGNRVECHITDRGRGILAGTIRARVQGIGEYRGAAAIRASHEDAGGSSADMDA